MQMKTPLVSINVTDDDLLHRHLMLLVWMTRLVSLHIVFACDPPMNLCLRTSQRFSDHVLSIAKTAC